MNRQSATRREASTASPQWHESKLAVEIGEHRFLLDDGRIAHTALTCLIEPRVGDRVLVATCADASCYVVHVLARPAGAGHADATLSAPGVERLSIKQRSLELVAAECAALRSLKHVEIVAAAGTLTVSANDLYRTVLQTVVDTMQHYVGHAENYLLDVEQLLRQHGAQVMVTAEKDVKVDADRISMG
ncbi:DUF3540 domain-containing protein [Paraburkholderia humisilvae]|uniref:DUF3540 domain-containing protein n=1 Tax=Paraburkholderia humisilvae TaxID=627669 RepID=A0A6J5EW44_9BURK|nr:DUF3540 domain-containing protein [Paraburkholderia humisilvae]CAB3770204.1 hypothetical protein LMG29542_06299 [Paraburkholderia humisilvae]